MPKDFRCGMLALNLTAIQEMGQIVQSRDCRRIHSVMTNLEQRNTDSKFFQRGTVALRATVLALSCVMSFWLITHLLVKAFRIQG